MENLQGTPSPATITLPPSWRRNRTASSALRIKTLADHGYTDAAANPSKFPAGLFHICTGSYDFQAAHVEVDGVYTNKPPGGIAYRCSFRVTEAVHTIERMVDIMAHELQMDPAEFRKKNFIAPERFPYTSALGWEYDSGNYGAASISPCTRSGMPNCDGAGRKAATGRAHGHRDFELHRDRRGRSVQTLRHPRPEDVR